MIKFFRKIRQRLLTENKFSKYFIYAVGEIILVVIGILIALQINNWNQGKKNNQLEVEILQEIKNGLEGDLTDITLNIGIHESVLRSQDIVIEWLSSTETFRDSLAYHFSNVSNGSVFVSNEGPYENLKQLGMRLVSSDSLRLQIMNVYDMQFQDYKDHNNYYIELQFEFFKSRNSKHFKSTNPFNEMEPLNVEKIKADTEYSYHVETLRNFNRFFIGRKLKPAQSAAEKTIKMIEQELHK